MTSARDEYLREQCRAKRESLELHFLRDLRACQLPEPVREYTFHPVRKWRFDFAWLEPKIAVEIEGGIFTKGVAGHDSINGIKRDIEKHNAAVLLDWRVFRFHTDDVTKGEAVRMMEQVFR